MKDSKYKGGMSSRKSKMDGMEDCGSKPIKRAMGGVAKIRHGQSTPAGNPKTMRRASRTQ